VTFLKRDFIRNAVHCTTHSEVKFFYFSPSRWHTRLFSAIGVLVCRVIESKPAYFMCNICRFGT